MKKIKDKATMENLPAFMEFVQAFAEDAGANQEVLQKLELAMEEALVNIIHYAYEDTSGDIEVQAVSVANGIKYTLIDNGIAFDVLAKSDPDTSLSLEERGVGGLGIFLVKQMMDHTEYKRQDNQNILTLIKYY